MGKYKVGDKVKWNPNIEAGRTYDGGCFAQPEMAFKGEGYVTEVREYEGDARYSISGSHWVYTDQMLEPVDGFDSTPEPTDATDTNVGTSDNYDAEIIGIMQRQTEKGLEKYGAPLNENTTLTATQRIEHFQEEMIDGLRYAEHLKQCLKDNLTVADYQRAAMRTATPKCHNWFNICLGLSGQTGKVSDIFEKCEFQGHGLDKEHLVEKLGDVAWYLALAADTLGVSLEEILTRNIEKLKRRYPDGFSKDASINRTV